MSAVQDETVIFYTDDMALAAYLVFKGHEVSEMKSERKGSQQDQIYWGFDRTSELDGEVVGAMSGDVELHLYKFMGSLKEVRELMFEYRENPALFRL